MTMMTRILPSHAVFLILVFSSVATTNAGGWGDLCGLGKPDCDPNYDCVRTPLRKRCFPVKCAVEAAAASMESGFNLTEYGQHIEDVAGLENPRDMFRAIPGRNMNMFQQNQKTTAVLNAIEDNPPPVEQILADFNKCRSVNETKQLPPVAGYGGASWELGLLATYNGDVFFGQGTEDAAPVGILSNCFGVVLGYDAGVSGLVGFATTGSLANLDGCRSMIPLFDFPPFGVQIGVADLETSPIFIMEVTLGLSASVGLPGFTQCTTQTL